MARGGPVVRPDKAPDVARRPVTRLPSVARCAHSLRPARTRLTPIVIASRPKDNLVPLLIVTPSLHRPLHPPTLTLSATHTTAGTAAGYVNNLACHTSTSTSSPSRCLLKHL